MLKGYQGAKSHTFAHKNIIFGTFVPAARRCACLKFLVFEVVVPILSTIKTKHPNPCGTVAHAMDGGVDVT